MKMRKRAILVLATGLILSLFLSPSKILKDQISASLILSSYLESKKNPQR
jgi:hypothetical protein